MNEFAIPIASAARIAPAQLAEPADDDDEERVDDVARPSVGPTGPSSVMPTPARPARPEPMKNVVRSTRVVRTPETDASGRFCMTARIRRPAGVRCM